MTYHNLNDVIVGTNLEFSEDFSDDLILLPIKLPAGLNWDSFRHDFKCFQISYLQSRRKVRGINVVPCSKEIKNKNENQASTQTNKAVEV